MQCIKCPNRYDGDKTSIFIAGGITGCQDWQRSVEQFLSDTDVVLFNPRRDEFSDSNLEQEQVQWEHDYLMSCSAHMFFFPPDSMCPVTMFELGKVASLQKPLFVAIHPKFPRCRNVTIQLSIIRPDVKVVSNLVDLTSDIKIWLRSYD